MKQMRCGHENTHSSAHSGPNCALIKQIFWELPVNLIGNNFIKVSSRLVPALLHCACMASASASALIMNNHKNSINYVPTVASCLTPPMANSIASLGRGEGGGEGSGYSGCRAKWNAEM